MWRVWHIINASPTYWLSGFRSTFFDYDRRGTGDFLLFPFWETVSNVISTIVVENTPFISAPVDYSLWLLRIFVDVFRQKVTFPVTKCLLIWRPLLASSTVHKFLLWPWMSNQLWVPIGFLIVSYFWVKYMSTLNLYM